LIYGTPFRKIIKKNKKEKEKEKRVTRKRCDPFDFKIRKRINKRNFPIRERINNFLKFKKKKF
jgi:hypothetical protein